MLNIAPAAKNLKSRRRRRIGIAIAGGGPIGGIYELGALRALEDALTGLDLTRLDVYVGVSSGSFLAAALANRLDAREMCRMLLMGDAADVPFRPESFLKPAIREYLSRLAQVPSLVLEMLSELILRPWSSRWAESLGKLGGALPTGFFDSGEIEAYLRTLFSTFGRSNDFRRLERALYVVAVELDTGKAVRFGAPGHDHVPISRAIQASAALPGLYPPVEIDGRLYVDGALRRTMHASVALEADIDLLIGINPLVPFDANLARAAGKSTPPSITEGGLPAVLSQTFRALLQSRMQVGLEKYNQTYVQTDKLVFEPDPDDAEMFFTNIFSFRSRWRLCEHAYRVTLRDLGRHRAELRPLLARHGIGLDDAVLDAPARRVTTGIDLRPPRRTEVTARLDRALKDLRHILVERGVDLDAARR